MNLKDWKMPLFTMGVFSASCTYLRKGQISGARMRNVMDQHLQELDAEGKKKLINMISVFHIRETEKTLCILDHNI